MLEILEKKLVSSSNLRLGGVPPFYIATLNPEVAATTYGLDVLERHNQTRKLTFIDFV